MVVLVLIYACVFAAYTAVVFAQLRQQRVTKLARAWFLHSWNFGPAQKPVLNLDKHFTGRNRKYIKPIHIGFNLREAALSVIGRVPFFSTEVDQMMSATLGFSARFMNKLLSNALPPRSFFNPQCRNPWRVLRT
jgi:hypothetical protein